VTEEEQRGRLVTQLRESRLWTRERLAQEASVSITTVTGVEEGRTRVRLRTIEKLANALEVAPLKLLHPEDSLEEPGAPKDRAPLVA
jgi:transcriptional regulator with XRE-family HTH domain